MHYEVDEHVQPSYSDDSVNVNCVLSWKVVGFTAGLKGEKKEELAQSREESPVLPFEFGEFTQELIENVLRPAGKERVVFLCDEANQMPIFRQEQILDRYLDIFRSRPSQFLFVAGMYEWEKATSLPACFDYIFELRGFPNADYVKELIDVHLKVVTPPCPRLSDQVFAVIVRSILRAPHLTLEACRRAFNAAVDAGDAVIGVGRHEGLQASRGRTQVPRGVGKEPIGYLAHAPELNSLVGRGALWIEGPDIVLPHFRRERTELRARPPLVACTPKLWIGVVQLARILRPAHDSGNCVRWPKQRLGAGVGSTRPAARPGRQPRSPPPTRCRCPQR